MLNFEFIKVNTILLCIDIGFLNCISLIFNIYTTVRQLRVLGVCCIKLIYGSVLDSMYNFLLLLLFVIHIFSLIFTLLFVCNYVNEIV